ncbi:MAG: MBL fold metallo-hydrolase [Thermodesulfobacteriota bacterium]
MKSLLLLAGSLLLIITFSANAREMFETDTIETSQGNLKITFIGHGTLMFTFNGRVIHIDPVGREADYTGLPKADMVLLTHDHSDHLDPAALAILRQDKTAVVLPEICTGKVKDGMVLKNGESRTVNGLKIEAVAAYNLIHMRSEGAPYHPKGVGNGYIVTFGDKRVYVAGDTENTPEMKRLKNIDIAFLPMNLPYTMTPAMAADAARTFKPKILYPYHFGDSDTAQLVNLLADTKDVAVRIRKLK